MSTLAQPPLSVRTHHHTINFEKSEVFYTKKCGRPHLSSPCPKNVRTGQTPSSLSADVFYGRPLSYDVIFTLIFVLLIQHSLSFGPRAATVSAYRLIEAYRSNAMLNTTFYALFSGLGTHLFVKVPRPGDGKVTFSVFRVKLPPVTTSLTTQW